MSLRAEIDFRDGHASVARVNAEASSLPALEPGGYHELRVHGVAGSSPESMLGLQAELAGLDTARQTDCNAAVGQETISVWAALVPLLHLLGLLARSLIR